MHLHAEHSLFFEQRMPLWRAALSLGVTCCVLIANVGANSTTASLAGSGVGVLLLLVAYIRGHRRLEPAFAWTLLLVGLALLGGMVLGGEMRHVAAAAARVACGVIWVLWLGTQVDWASLRRILLAIRVPEEIVTNLDHALMHGVLTQREWGRRRDAARLRLGTARLPLSAWGQLLGEGTLQAFLRLERVEEHAMLRSHAVSAEHTDQALTLDSIQVRRGEQTVLEDLALQLEPGELILLCGPSGAGKSSLLRLLAGLDGPAQGTMRRLGAQVSAADTLHARLDGRVALLSQNPENHFVASTVSEDIMWGLLRRGVNAERAQTRCTDIATSLGIAHLLERPCHALSFGEQRRVALAGLLVLEPALLLLDEPTSGLDPVSAHHLRVLVEQSIQQTGAACVWATHDLHSVPSLAKRVVLLHNGRSIFDGPTSEGLSNDWLVRAGLALPTPG
ncbi:MAG: hypothetical protein CL927_05005 [Deltaproteobacteria bacterium]|nr:hypothetical protein [Deltaproteobacteria bacterium]HCH65449.1 hypothetical protein [Deltaproteobacteria bacterium]